MHGDVDGHGGDHVVLVQLECGEHVHGCVGVNVDADVGLVVVEVVGGVNVNEDEDLMQVARVGADAGGDVDVDLVAVEGAGALQQDRAHEEVQQ